jgi:hypothetical protein
MISTALVHSRFSVRQIVELLAKHQRTLLKQQPLPHSLHSGIGRLQPEQFCILARKYKTKTLRLRCRALQYDSSRAIGGAHQHNNSKLVTTSAPNKTTGELSQNARSNLFFMGAVAAAIEVVIAAADENGDFFLLLLLGFLGGWGLARLN